MLLLLLQPLQYGTLQQRTRPALWLRLDISVALLRSLCVPKRAGQLDQVTSCALPLQDWCTPTVTKEPPGAWQLADPVLQTSP